MSDEWDTHARGGPLPKSHEERVQGELRAIESHGRDAAADLADQTKTIEKIEMLLEGLGKRLESAESSVLVLLGANTVLLGLATWALWH